MTIAIVSTAYPLRGGIAQYTAILYNKLTERGHDVHVITFKRQYPKMLFPGKSQLDASRDETAKIPTEVILDSINPVTWFQGYRRIAQLKCELVIFKYWMPFFAPCYGMIAWLAKKFSGAQILFLCDNIIPHERRVGDVALTEFAFRSGDFFIVQSDVVKEQLLKLFPKARYRVVAHPVYEIFGDPIEKSEAKRRLNVSDERVILFFGYVRTYKGLDLLLDAMPKILREVKVRLLVVGEFYENEAGFRKQIADLGITATVDVRADFVANEDVSLYFSACDVVVLPYRSATQSGIVQIAYQLHKPCIVTNVGGLAEVVIDHRTGFVVAPDNPSSLADAVIRFYRERRELEFVENVKVEKPKYSWDNMIRAIETAVESDGAD
jgi:glycosyltransferase involved in cell wall biosynthesis